MPNRRRLLGNVSEDSKLFWQHLLQKHHEHIRRRLVRSRPWLPPDQIEDLAQDTFIKLYEYWDSLTEHGMDELHIINTVIKWVLGSDGRLSKKRSHLSVTSNDENNSTELDDNGESAKSTIARCDRNTLIKIISTLSSKEFDILYLHFFENLSALEISNRLGSTPGNIRVKLHRIIKKLESKLAK